MKETMYLSMDLQLFSEGEPSFETSGVEDVQAADGQTEGETQTEGDVGGQTEPTDDLPDDKRFAKALKARTAQMEAQIKQTLEQQYAERYQGYDDFKFLSDYMLEQNGVDDINELKRRIEMTRLEEQAAEQNVPVEVLERLQKLEQESKEYQELKQQQEQQQLQQQFRTLLGEFAQEKGVDATQLEQFMIDSGIHNPEMAYRAMKFEDVEAKRQEIEKEAINKFLAAKSNIPRVDANSSPSAIITQAPKTFKEASQRALARMTGQIT